MEAQPHGIEREPSAAELDAIEHEWPLIDAELALLDAHIRMTCADDPSPLDWRRLRRAEHRVMREAAVVAQRPAGRLVSRRNERRAA